MRLATCLQAKDMETSMWSQSDGHQSIPLFVPPEFTSARCPSHPENHPVRFHISSPQPRATNDWIDLMGKRGPQDLRICFHHDKYSTLATATAWGQPFAPRTPLPTWPPLCCRRVATVVAGTDEDTISIPRVATTNRSPDTGLTRAPPSK